MHVRRDFQTSRSRFSKRTESTKKRLFRFEPPFIAPKRPPGGSFGR